MCELCERAYLKTAVPGFTPGQECYGCAPSSSGTGIATSTETMTLSDVETISLGSDPTASTTFPYGDPGASETLTTPTPATGPTGNLPYGPPSALPAYVTAGSARTVARAGLVGIVFPVVMGMLVW